MRRIPTECDGCQNRTETCHATCEIHREAWEARRKRNDDYLKHQEATEYTVSMIKKCKGHASVNLRKYQPKEGR